MITKLVGYFTLFWGILWFVKPQLLRWWLVGKANRYIFWLAAAVLLYPVVHYVGRFGLRWVLAILVVFWVGMAMFRERFRKAVDQVPLMAFRAAGFLNIVSGVALLVLAER
ncbi:MAG: hypothetical protein MOGMAGMI_02253 [Candidatus Omnitrophica bacterium]|nr:hypothetical protein [Candidatus Omnitrophota bacterium]